MKEELYMKVVVIRSPKFISGILRVIFRIKKEEE
ncbi:MAG: stage V sporulation protein SpoVM [Ruminococcus sp.]|nr:stage V sporulation protein SpoVM [Ruminococcus sp.]